MSATYVETLSNARDSLPNAYEGSEHANAVTAR